MVSACGVERTFNQLIYFILGINTKGLWVFQAPESLTGLSLPQKAMSKDASEVFT